MDYMKKSSDLLIWKGICSTQQLLKKCACAYLQIGDGTTIDIWQDPWIPWTLDFKAHPLNNQTRNLSSLPKLVCDLVNSNMLNDIWDA